MVHAVGQFVQGFLLSKISINYLKKKNKKKKERKKKKKKKVYMTISNYKKQILSISNEMKMSRLIHFRGVKWSFYFFDHFTLLEITNRLISISVEMERIFLPNYLLIVNVPRTTNSVNVSPKLPKNVNVPFNNKNTLHKNINTLKKKLKKLLKKSKITKS
jgi:hypothetical protein